MDSTALKKIRCVEQCDESSFKDNLTRYTSIKKVSNSNFINDCKNLAVPCPGRMCVMAPRDFLDLGHMGTTPLFFSIFRRQTILVTSYKFL